MSVEAYYTNVLPGHLIGPMRSYAHAVSTIYTPVRQDYLGEHYRTVSVHRLPVGHPIEEHIVKSMVYFNKEAFEYDLSGSFEIQLMHYMPGDGFDWHCDYGLCSSTGQDRKLSFTLQLSDAWEYNGGELDIMNWYNQPNTLSKECGAFIVFDSRVPHKVRRVTEGERYSIVAWAHGPKLR